MSFLYQAPSDRPTLQRRRPVHHPSVAPTQVGVAIARALEAAGASSRLRSLSLRGNLLGFKTVAALGRALEVQGPCGALRALDLGWNLPGGGFFRGVPGDAASMEALARGIRAGPSRLETLLLTGNPLSAESAHFLAAALSEGEEEAPEGQSACRRRHCWLRTLHLGERSVDDAAAAALLRGGLRSNRSLTVLDLSSNRLSDQGVLSLAQWAAEERFGVPLTPQAKPQEDEDRENRPALLWRRLLLRLRQLPTTSSGGGAAAAEETTVDKGESSQQLATAAGTTAAPPPPLTLNLRGQNIGIDNWRVPRSGAAGNQGGGAKGLVGIGGAAAVRQIVAAVNAALGSVKRLTIHVTEEVQRQRQQQSEAFAGGW